MRTDLRIQLNFDERYIAHPYWPEREELINIQKGSGMNRARSEQKREDSLNEYLKRIGLTREQYDELEAKADFPWYKEDMRNDDPTARIIISTHQLYGCLIEACKKCTAAIRPCEATNFRHVVRLTDFLTEKTHSDGLYRRTVQPKDGKGNPLSNQRSLRINPFIEKFTAVGTVSFFTDDIRDEGEYMLDFLEYAGQRVGVGASRKMGMGRFTPKRI